MAWIKKGPLFQRATFNLDSFSLLAGKRTFLGKRVEKEPFR